MEMLQYVILNKKPIAFKVCPYSVLYFLYKSIFLNGGGRGAQRIHSSPLH